MSGASHLPWVDGISGIAKQGAQWKLAQSEALY